MAPPLLIKQLWDVYCRRLEADGTPCDLATPAGLAVRDAFYAGVAAYRTCMEQLARDDAPVAFIYDVMLEIDREMTAWLAQRGLPQGRPS